MKIVFLCSCADVGKDGVGDYTALIARECGRRGHKTLVVALNDGFVGGFAAGDGVLRLGTAMGWRERVERAREAVASFGAEVVSLQWVPYGFHPKGISWKIEKGLGRIVGGRPAQVMCHEVWIGAEAGASLRCHVAGAVQRMVMKRIFRTLRAGCVQTSNAAYAGLLRQAGLEAEVLPLFGAIPVRGVRAVKEDGIVRFGMFGELHPKWPPEPLLGRLRDMGKRIEIAHIGGMSQMGEAAWRKMKQRYAREFAFKRLGQQPPERVSQFLMEMDFGIATTPLALIGKSGTATAMLEHGLPVIVNRNDVQYPGVEAGDKPEGVIVMDGDFICALQEAPRREPRSRLPEVADQFLESLIAIRAGKP